MGDTAALLQRYAKAHRLGRLVVLLLALATCEWLMGGTVLTLPGSHQPVRIAFRHELPLVFASVAVASLGSALDWAQAAAPGTVRYRATHAGVVLATTVLLVTTTELLTTTAC